MADQLWSMTRIREEVQVAIGSAQLFHCNTSTWPANQWPTNQRHSYNMCRNICAMAMHR